MDDIPIRRGYLPGVIGQAGPHSARMVDWRKRAIS